MSDLREQIARELWDEGEVDPGPPPDYAYTEADAVLRVVKDALTGEEAVNAARRVYLGEGRFDPQGRSRAALAAAWASITEGGTDE